ncbi:Fructosamine kinase-domain-containing protein [Xylariales sp. AK1849]|nr:Fructosamine kinase-domain-containing protein [Xylariales sp. AK1849]
MINGQPRSYFLKVTDAQPGAIMFSGEVESLKTIGAVMPGFCPRPIGWGQYKSNPALHFFLCEFVEMWDEPMNPETLPRRLAEMHSKGKEPNGLYGFHQTVAGGVLPVNPGRSTSWEDYFFRYMRVLMKAEEIAQGPPPPVLVRLLDVLFHRVIPRLLRPLETGGREIVPRFVHSDL